MQTKAVDIQEAQHKLRELISLAQSGWEVLLVEGDQPVARLVTATRVAGLHTGALSTSDDFDEPLPEEFWTGRP